MDIREYDIKGLPYHFVLFYNIEASQMAMYRDGYKGKADDNAVLTYCYLDLQCGLSYHVVCCAKIDDKGKVEFTSPEGRDTGITIREGGLNTDAIVINEEDLEQFQKEAAFVKKHYGYHPEMVKVDETDLFGKYRHPSYPDDILVLFSTPDKQIEKMWVTELKTLGEGLILAKVLNEPFCTNMGVHEGELVQVTAQEDGEGGYVPIAILPWMRELD